MITSVGFLGAGNMAEALLKGMLEQKLVSPEQIYFVELNQQRSTFLCETYGITACPSLEELESLVDILFLAVKPQQMEQALATRPATKPSDTVFVSIAAGISLETLQHFLGQHTQVIRVMPNTPALVGEGVSAISPGKGVSEETVERITALLDCTGITVKVREKDMDSVTALSGSGPAYLFYLLEAMVQAGIDMGLSPETASTLARQTVRGAAGLALSATDSPTVLREKVTSPGGTTEAAIQHLEAHQVSMVIKDAMMEARKRSVVLSKR